ncbi:MULTISPECIES: poly(ethylene terephthalate) hydrolase family protein [unclassified Streptomyces]|uniref:poly(ethylene terephthalate) hydrolase family protein n=1 Tax=unclassified Streptomyces TaxID=2593676 RepID=UPI002E33E6FA|nr:MULTISPECIES: alpha/beta hydrolase [unclassified Streptomyces]
MFRRLLRTVSVPAIPLTLAVAFAVPSAATAATPAPSTAAAVDPSSAGPFAVAHTDLTVSAAGRSFAARVWYPGTTAGADAPVAAGPHPGLAFGHGFFQDISKYESLLTHYASWGVITVAPKSQAGLFPSHSGFADDLNASLTWLTAQNSTGGSRFAGAVDTARLGLSGHSMGGGAALLAAGRNSAVKAVSTLAAAETDPSAVTASGTLSMPAQYVGGSADSIAGVAGNQQKMYDAKPSPTQLRVITGGFHCGFVDSSGIGCDSGSLSRAVQQRLTRGITTAYLLYTWGVDDSLYNQVWGSAARNLAGVVYSAKP